MQSRERCGYWVGNFFIRDVRLQIYRYLLHTIIFLFSIHNYIATLQGNSSKHSQIRHRSNHRSRLLPRRWLTMRINCGVNSSKLQYMRRILTQTTRGYLLDDKAIFDDTNRNYWRVNHAVKCSAHLISV
jgi:hypothetical protein